MQEYKVKESALTATADAIRAKTGGTDKLTWDEDGGYEDAVGTISGYGRQLVEKTITEIDDDSITTIGTYAFYSCKNLVSARFSNVSALSTYAFGECSALETAVLEGFAADTKLNTFRSCTSLKVVDLGSCASIAAATFYGCSVLDTLILRGDSVCSLAGTAAFNGTPFVNVGVDSGTVYVPSVLIAEYQAATNWASLYEGETCNFVALEGSEYE